MLSWFVFQLGPFAQFCSYEKQMPKSGPNLSKPTLKRVQECPPKNAEKEGQNDARNTC